MNTTTINNLKKTVAANYSNRNTTGWTGSRSDDPSRMVIRSAIRCLRLA